ncbi:MAG: hypothetical protein ABSF12_16300 [Bryobacteraceae bacterium]
MDLRRVDQFANFLNSPGETITYQNERFDIIYSAHLQIGGVLQQPVGRPRCKSFSKEDGEQS